MCASSGILLECLSVFVLLRCRAPCARGTGALHGQLSSVVGLDRHQAVQLHYTDALVVASYWRSWCLRHGSVAHFGGSGADRRFCPIQVFVKLAVAPLCGWCAAVVMPVESLGFGMSGGHLGRCLCSGLHRIALFSLWQQFSWICELTALCIHCIIPFGIDFVLLGDSRYSSGALSLIALRL